MIKLLKKTGYNEFQLMLFVVIYYLWFGHFQHHTKIIYPLDQQSMSSINLLIYISGMKVVSITKRGNQIEIIKPMANFRENADFLPIGLALSGNRKKKSGSQVSTFLIVTTLSPIPALSVLDFMF